MFLPNTNIGLGAAAALFEPLMKVLSASQLVMKVQASYLIVPNMRPSLQPTRVHKVPRIPVTLTRLDTRGTVLY